MKGFTKKRHLLVCVLVTISAGAQEYAGDWHKVAAGGSTSTNGQYAVTGTIGQPDASERMSGGAYAITGGFWSLLAVVQTPGAPTLTITRWGSTTVISWPYPSSGFELQQNNGLSLSNWIPASLTVATNNLLNSVTISAPAGKMFFRLKAP